MPVISNSINLQIYVKIQDSVMS